MRGNRSDGAGNTRPGIRVPVAMPSLNRISRNDFADSVAFFQEIAAMTVHLFLRSGKSGECPGIVLSRVKAFC